MARSSSILTKEKFSKLVGERIRKIREEKGISVRTFEAKDDSLDRHALSKIENGKTTPSIYTLYKISKILEVDIHELLKELY